MVHKEYNPQRCLFIVTFICCAGVLISAVSGCTPLRKKFTRKKKEDKEQSQKFIPVLEPVDYPAKVYSSEEHYKRHYSLWKVWDRDLLQAVERDDSDKRQKYLLGQAIEQLEEMKKWLADEKQAELDEVIDGFRKAQQEYERPPPMRNKFSMRKKIKLNAKKVQHGFSPKLPLPYRE